MKQMETPSNVPILTIMNLSKVESGFASIRGKIFFLGMHGKFTYLFPVLADGTISNHGTLEFPIRVPLIHPQDLGISNIRWVDDYPAPL